jgi:UDP-3-O-[3-hydroxymyristoyl] glucosamine N-acyltransferase
MELTAKTIAQHVGGTIEGNADTIVRNFARIEQARDGDLCFLANPKYEEHIYKTNASLAIVNKSFTLKRSVTPAIIWVDNAYQSIAIMLNLYAALNVVKRKGRERPSHVSRRAKIGKDCYVGAFSYIASGARIGNGVKIFPHVYIGENTSIGDGTILYPKVTIYAGCSIGTGCIVHSGAVIGADGFGFVPDENRVYKKIEQVGNVTIGNDVEIGANTCIDRATMNSTVIHDGVKLDNLIHLAHNVEVGSNTVMAGGSCIAGSVKIGERCMFGGQVGISPHIIIGNDAMIGAQSGIMQNVPEKGSVLGAPAIEFRQYMKAFAVFKNLYDLQKLVYAIKQKIGLE